MRGANVEVVAVEEMLSIAPGHRDAVGPGLIGQTARKVDGLPEPVAANENRRPRSNTAMQGRQRVDGSKPREEIKRDLDRAIEAVSDEHHLVPNELHDSTRMSRDDIESCRLEDLDDLSDLLRTCTLADSREARKIGKANCLYPVVFSHRQALGERREQVPSPDIVHGALDEADRFGSNGALDSVKGLELVGSRRRDRGEQCWNDRKLGFGKARERRSHQTREACDVVIAHRSSGDHRIETPHDVDVLGAERNLARHHLGETHRPPPTYGSLRVDACQSLHLGALQRRGFDPD